MRKSLKGIKGKIKIELSDKLKGLVLSQETFDKFGYRPEDLSFGSSKRVIHKCDVCSEKKETIHNIFIKERGLSHWQCSFEKQRQTLQERYGVANVSLLEEVKEKKRQTCLKHFGVVYPGQSEVIKKRQRQTFLLRYGVDHPRKVKSTALQGINKKIQQTAWKNQGVDSSIENLNEAIIQHIQAKAKEEGYRLLSTEYKGAHSKLDFQCSQGHQYPAAWSDFRFGYRCPECGRGKRETLLGQILEQIFPGQVRPQDSLGFLGLQQVDYSIRGEKLAFEHDGEQHFRPTRFAGVSVKEAEENFKVQKQRDRRKNRLCKKNSYRVIRIRYDEELTLESVKAKIG